MRRRHPDDRDPQVLARIAREASWWAKRAQVNTELTQAEQARYRALRQQQDNPEACIDAIIATSVAAPAVAGSVREDWT